MASPQPHKNMSKARPSKRKVVKAIEELQEDEDEGQQAGPSGARVPMDEDEDEEDANEQSLAIAEETYNRQAEEEADANSVSVGERDRLVRIVMRFMLFRQHQKPGMPVPRAEISKVILANYKNQKVRANLTKSIIMLAQAKFVEIFGMEMKDVKMKQLDKRGGEVETGKPYVLRSLLSDKLRALVRSDAADLNQGLAMVLMSLITISGGKLHEEELWRHLKDLGVRQEEAHPTFGMPDEQIQVLVQKKQLIEMKENSPDGPRKVYGIGNAALDEVQEPNLMAFIDKVFNT